MKFIDTIKTDITWLVVQGTDAELNDLSKWIDQNRTMYVIHGKREKTMMVVDHDMKPSHRIAIGIVGQFKNGILQQRFGFKSTSDALRCRLTVL